MTGIPELSALRRCCGHRTCALPGREPLLTAPNVVTVVRTAGALWLGALGMVQASLGLLAASLAVYWIGDTLDGQLARWLDQETRRGGVLDILCDRLCAVVFYVGYAVIEPGMAWPVALYLAEFVVVDCVLSLAFLAWPLRSPNYFHLVDRTIWRWNWSRPAKALNSGLFALLMVVTGSAVLAGGYALAVMALKLASLARLQRLDEPRPAGCAVPVPKPAAAVLA